MGFHLFRSSHGLSTPSCYGRRYEASSHCQHFRNRRDYRVFWFMFPRCLCNLFLDSISFGRAINLQRNLTTELHAFSQSFGDSDHDWPRNRLEILHPQHLLPGYQNQVLQIGLRDA